MNRKTYVGLSLGKRWGEGCSIAVPTSRERGSTSVHTRRRMTSMARRPATAAHSFQGTTCACNSGKEKRI